MYCIAPLNFTLFVFQLQVGQLILLTLTCQGMFALKRRQLARLLELLREPFSYAEPGEAATLGAVTRAAGRQKLLLLTLPALAAGTGLNIVTLGPYLDSNFGDIGFNASAAGYFTGVPVPGIYPFRVPPEDWLLWAVVLSSLQMACFIFVATVILVGVTLFINPTVIIVTNFMRLIASVRNIEERAETLYTSIFEGPVITGQDKYANTNFLKCYEECLKKNFKHHQVILRLIETFQDIYSGIIGCAFMVGSIVIALSFLSLKTGTSLPGTMMNSFMACISEILIMAMLATQGQRIVDYSEELRFTVYSLKWHMTNKSIKQNITIFQEKTLQPALLKGFGLVDCNMATFSNVMNSAYSYYNLLMAF